jgi:hypothetical protein
MTDQRLQKWYHWLTAHISAEIQGMHLHREAWLGVQEILSNNDALPDSYWWEYMGDTYAITQAVAVRRMAEKNKGVISLGRLVREMSEDSARLTQEFFLTRFGPDPTTISWATNFWNEHFAGRVGGHLDPDIPSADFEKITAASASVKSFVDEHFAHRDQSAQPADSAPTLTDVHHALDVMAPIFQKYHGLMTGVPEPTLLPRFDHDWRVVFRQPWIQEKSTG